MSPCRAGEQIVSTDGISAPASGGDARLLGGSNEQNRTSGMGSRLYDPRRTSSKGNGLYDDRSDGHIDPVRGRRSCAVSGVNTVSFEQDGARALNADGCRAIG